MPPSSLCSSLFVFQRVVFKLGGVLSLNLYLSVDQGRFPFVLCVGGWEGVRCSWQVGCENGAASRAG